LGLGAGTAGFEKMEENIKKEKINDFFTSFGTT
jgi:hypothetical protein